MVSERKKNSEASPTLKVGVDDRSVPDTLSPTDSADEQSWWDSLTKTSPRADRELPSKWKSSSSEEIERFRHVPVMGRLPWRLQYITAIGILLVSLFVLLFTASRLLPQASPGQAKDVYAGLIALDEGVLKALKGQPVDTAAQKSALAKASAQASVSSRSVSQKWKEISALSKDLESYQTNAKEVVVASNQIYAISTETLTQVTEAWRRAGNTGEWESVDAVNFAQVISDMQYIQNSAQMISQGRGDISARLSTSRQNIEQSLRIYASSPAALQQSNIRQAYTVVAAGFAKMRPYLDVVMGRATGWNNLLGMSEIVSTQKNELIKEIASSAPTTSTASGVKKTLWLSGVFVISSLFLILVVGWKQQKWQVLHARSSYEELQVGVDHISRQLNIVSSGDLSGKIRATSEYFQPMADAINSTIQKLKMLLGGIKSTAIDASSTMSTVSEKAGALIESSNDAVSSFESNVNAILKMASAVQNIADLADESQQSSSDVIERVTAGKSATEKATECMHEVYEKSEEAASRVQRVKRSSESIQQVSALQSEISSQIDILAIQAALQATKAGESGQGFRVVADALKSLAQKSSDGSRRVSSLVEASIGDLVSLDAILVKILEQAQNGAKLSDMSMENALLVSSTLDQLDSSILTIKTISSDEIENANLLSENLSLGMEKAEEQKRSVEEAAGSLLDVVSVIQELDESVSKFKIK